MNGTTHVRLQWFFFIHGQRIAGENATNKVIRWDYIIQNYYHLQGGHLLPAQKTEA